MEFISARAKTIFTEKGLRHDEIEACLSIDGSDFTELYRRARSISDFRKDDKFSEMLLSFKWMNNILAGFRKENAGHGLSFDASLLQEKEEKELYDFFNSRKNRINELIASSRYIELFELLIQGKSIIDSFFDRVLVMDERMEVRDTRLAMLEGILSNFSGLLDFSKISDK
jgi:glycyl-tRNA synthetase beta chain